MKMSSKEALDWFKRQEKLKKNYYKIKEWLENDKQ